MNHLPKRAAVRRTLIAIICFLVSDNTKCPNLTAEELAFPKCRLEIRFVLEGVPGPEFEANSEISEHPFKISPDNNGIADVVFWLDLKRNLDLKEIKIPKVPMEHEIKPKKHSWEPRFTIAMVGDKLIYDGTKYTEPHALSGVVNYAVSFSPNEVHRLNLLEECTIMVPQPYYCVFDQRVDGYILTLPHRWAAASRSNGEVRLDGVPAGARQFRIWHERCGWVKTVKVNGKPTQIDKGILTLDLKPNSTERFEILIPLENFKLPKSLAKPNFRESDGS